VHKRLEVKESLVKAKAWLQLAWSTEKGVYVYVIYV